MTNSERHARIDAIYDLAAREHRPVTLEELDEIERLSQEIYAESHRWLNSTLPIPEGASQAA